MGKISIGTLEAPVVGLPRGFAGDVETQGYFRGDGDPLHVHLHKLGVGAELRVGPLETDCIVYVWKGGVQAGGRRLAEASSLIVEHGAEVAILGEEAQSVLLTFFAARPSPERRAGGHVHLLPTEEVPRSENLTGDGGVGGGLHADASCPTCQVWLHENKLAPREEDPAGAEAGVHSHSEDEVIFVIEGQMQLGKRLYGPGTALAIPADTLYSFGIGPEGLAFVNFRAGLPAEIKFKNGASMDEVGFWRKGVGAPKYLEPL